jgi:arsenate reductase (thioredoxin)
MTVAREARTRVLFLCTGNSARSQMAEAILERVAGDYFEVESAGTQPKGVNPLTLRVLDEAGIDWSAAESKPVERFLKESFDYVITVCDGARQACPVFPGADQSLHWDLADPAEVAGSDDERIAAFRSTYADLTDRIGAFVRTASARHGALGVPVQRRTRP